MAKFAEWLNAAAAGGAEGKDSTNGDFLRAFLTNVAKAIIALLDALGEWPVEVE
jgi:hypothetical protein